MYYVIYINEFKLELNRILTVSEKRYLIGFILIYFILLVGVRSGFIFNFLENFDLFKKNTMWDQWLRAKQKWIISTII